MSMDLTAEVYSRVPYINNLECTAGLVYEENAPDDKDALVELLGPFSEWMLAMELQTVSLES